jgi:hypothetical protein
VLGRLARAGDATGQMVTPRQAVIPPDRSVEPPFWRVEFPRPSGRTGNVWRDVNLSLGRNTFLTGRGA